MYAGSSVGMTLISVVDDEGEDANCSAVLVEGLLQTPKIVGREVREEVAVGTTVVFTADILVDTLNDRLRDEAGAGLVRIDRQPWRETL